jgi:glycosyltransferase involved in cell wall biosynthesis
MTHRYYGRAMGSIRKRVLNNAKRIVTYGTMTTKTVTDMGIDPSKIVQTFNTVDVEYFYHLSRKLRESIPSENGHVFLYVGQLIARKNVSSIIKAFDHFSAPDDLLLIVGSGKLKTDLESLSRSLGLSQRVKFLGSLNGEELVRAYARSNTLILASTNEVWGLVVNEALACGLNVVVSSNCGVAEDVKKMSGVYISDNSVQSIGTMMERSRLDWTKHNSNPEILKYNPKRTALDIMRAIELLN